MSRTRTQAHQVQQLLDTRVAGTRLGADQAKWHLDVLGRGQDRQEPEVLEDEGNRASAKSRELRLVHRAHFVAIDDHPAGR